jgi:hypothetical protein
MHLLLNTTTLLILLFLGVAVQVVVSASSSLVINGAGVTIKSLELDGALIIDAAPGVELTVEELKVENKGIEFVPLGEDEAAAADEVLQLRGYKVSALLPGRVLLILCVPFVQGGAQRG